MEVENVQRLTIGGDARGDLAESRGLQRAHGGSRNVCHLIFLGQLEEHRKSGGRLLQMHGKGRELNL